MQKIPEIYRFQLGSAFLTLLRPVADQMKVSVKEALKNTAETIKARGLTATRP